MPASNHSTESNSSRETRAFAWYDPRRALGRLLCAAAMFVIVYALTPSSVPYRCVAAWDAGSLLLLSWMWMTITRSDVDETRRRAGSEDPGRTLSWLISLGSSAFSLFAATVVLRQAKSLSPHQSAVLVGFSLAAILSAWALTHSSYAFRYAHLYYRDDGGGEGGLEFPGKDEPNDFDFAYFAFTVGMCFQVSDVTVSSRLIRRAVLGQALLSFIYNTTILAIAVNLVVGLLG